MYVNRSLKLHTVVFYATTDDRRPVEEWLDSLDDARAEAVAMGIKFFEEYPNPIVPAKFFEKVAGTHLWEIKCHYGKEQYRLLAFMEGNSIIIATHGFSKKPGKSRAVRCKWRKPGAKNIFIEKNNQQGSPYERHRKIYP